jgi:hypothetical protein
MKILVSLIIFLSSAVDAKDCEISGRAILWAYDSCFWEYETDDSIHPRVIECVEKAQADIESNGECDSRRMFKSKICDMAKKWGVKTPNPETCMKIDTPLGPAVRDGGI